MHEDKKSHTSVVLLLGQGALMPMSLNTLRVQPMQNCLPLMMMQWTLLNGFNCLWNSRQNQVEYQEKMSH